MILTLAATVVKRDSATQSQQGTETVQTTMTKEVQTFVDELHANTTCCHSTTKTFTKNPLTEEDVSPSTKEKEEKTSSDDAYPSPQKNAKPRITVFMSYSVPKTIWQQLQYEAEARHQPIQFVIQGLPNNSFQELARKVFDYGCPVVIDPPLFERYNITAVPAFVINGGEKQQKRGESQRSEDHETVIFGTVSLRHVVERSHSTPQRTEVSS